MVLIMINGDLVPLAEAKISVMDHGFLFGNSIYEVIRTKRGCLWAVGHHLERLQYSAQKIGFVIPWSNELLIEELQRMVTHLALSECSLRLMLTRGIGPLKLDPSECINPSRIIFGKELKTPTQAMIDNGVGLVVSHIRKSAKGHEKGNPKTGNYLDSAIALRHATGEGAHEALLLNASGMVTECTTSNIFWVKNGCVFTPSLASGILKGMSRQIVLTLAAKLAIPHTEGLFTLDQLLEADEVFITSTSREVLPVSIIDKTTFPVGPITRKLIRNYGSVDVDNIAF